MSQTLLTHMIRHTLYLLVICRPWGSKILGIYAHEVFYCNILTWWQDLTHYDTSFFSNIQSYIKSAISVTIPRIRLYYPKTLCDNDSLDTASSNSSNSLFWPIIITWCCVCVCTYILLHIQLSCSKAGAGMHTTK